MTRTKNASTILQGEQDARPLMLHCARMVLRQFAFIEREREQMDDAGTWDDANAPGDMVLDMAVDTVRGWVVDLPERETFERQWWRLSAVATLALRGYQGPPCLYHTYLESLETALSNLPEVWQTVAEGLLTMEVAP